MKLNEIKISGDNLMILVDYLNEYPDDIAAMIRPLAIRLMQLQFDIMDESVIIVGDTLALARWFNSQTGQARIGVTFTKKGGAEVSRTGWSRSGTFIANQQRSYSLLPEAVKHALFHVIDGALGELHYPPLESSGDGRS